jgi:hypothetical protein
MKRLSFILVLFFCLALQAGGQHYIGKSKTEVREMMEENNRQLSEDKGARNTLFNMIKYVDRRGSQTLLYFFNEGDTCLYSKWMCDYSMLKRVVKDLNSSYKQTAEDSWSYKHKEEEFRITLGKGDWFFTITTKPKDKE